MPDGRARVIGRARSWTLGLALVLSSSALASCGGDDHVAQTTSTAAPDATVTTAPPAATTTTPPAATAPPATTPTATTGVPPAGGSSGGTAAPPESAPGGAGDEEAIRTPAAFSLDGGSATPRVVTVPAFLAIELRLTAKDGRAHTVLIKTTPPTTVSVGAGATAVKRLDGLKPGTYGLVIDGKESGAALRVGAEPGP